MIQGMSTKSKHVDAVRYHDLSLLDRLRVDQI